VLVVEVDHVLAEPLQARLAGGDDILGFAVDAVRAARVLRLAELGGEHDPVAPALDGATDHLLVMAPAIHVRGIEVVDALVDRVPDQCLGGRVVGLPIDARQRHAAKPDGRNGQAAGAERAVFKLVPSAHW